MQLTDNMDEQMLSSRVLIVDDDPTTRMLHRAMLAKQFDVVTASSGENALEICMGQLPDLVLLDVEMSGINGYETCRQLRAWASVPIIFATAHISLEEHLKAFDAGGDDLVTKPVDPEILLRKVALAIRRERERAQLIVEKNSLQTMAMSFLSTMGESGTLLNFMRAGVACRNFESLAEKLVAAIGEFGVKCSVMIRHGGESTVMTSRGAPTGLESAILEQSSSMGRIFQFGRQLAVNYDRVSIVLSDLPEDTERMGRVRDNTTILAETTEALAENVDMRQESMTRAEQMQVALIGAVSAIGTLQRKHHQMQIDSRILLQTLMDNVEKTYSWLGTNAQQEQAISETMGNSIDNILKVLATNELDSEFEQVLAALRGKDDDSNLELF